MESTIFGGLPLTWQKVTPGDTRTGVAVGVYKYREYELGYDSGDYAFAEGDLIVGATSGAMGIVRSVTVATGTVAGADAAGKITLYSWNGIAFADDEKIKVGSDSDVGDVDGAGPTERLGYYQHKEQIARSVIVTAVTKSQLITFGGKKILPDQTAKLGVTLSAGNSITIYDANAISNLTVVDETSGQAGSCVIVGCF